MVRMLQEHGHDIYFLWSQGHASIAGNEHADVLARVAAASTSLRPVARGISRSIVKSGLRHWFHERTIQQESTLARADSAPGEDQII